MQIEPAAQSSGLRESWRSSFCPVSSGTLLTVYLKDLLSPFSEDNLIHRLY